MATISLLAGVISSPPSRSLGGGGAVRGCCSEYINIMAEGLLLLQGHLPLHGLLLLPPHLLPQPPPPVAEHQAPGHDTLVLE